jgi:hypothetical protein
MIKKIKKIKKRLNHNLQLLIKYVKKNRIRSGILFGLTIIIATSLYVALQPLFMHYTYSLGSAGSLLSPINQTMAGEINHDSKQKLYTFANGSTSTTEITQTGAQKMSATLHEDASKGISVTDATNKTDFGLTPKYGLLKGKQDGNRIIYPLTSGTGWTVYTVQGTGVKEDIILNKSDSDTQIFEYKLEIGDSLEARVESDGGIGIYGNSVLSGNVATGSDADAALLVKAKQNAKKDKLLFSIPKPTILEKDGKQSTAKAVYSLQGKTLKVDITGLKHATYPLSIDPSIYVVTAQQFMAGNNETNIDFDVSNKLIKKAPTTGARFDAWNTTTNLPSTVWGAGTAAAGGYLYSAGGVASGTTVNQAVSWAKFNTSTGAIDSPNPGNGTCSGWCTSTDYNLPNPRKNFSLVAYNGFLYAMGGTDNTGTTQNTVYIAKIGANGEPQLWNPDWNKTTDPNKTTWHYWYTNTNLSSIRSDMTAVAYNNRMYLIGGRSTGGTPVNTVEVADITATGKLGTWTTSAANLPSTLYGHSSQVYNDYLYILGGAATVGGAPSSSVYYIKINSDGTLNGTAWKPTSNLPSGRLGGGGNFSVVWGAYIYVSSGCSTVNGSGYCTTVNTDSQVASINADGSIDAWSGIGSLSDQRLGFGMIAWRNKIYDIGGCAAQNTTNGSCTTILNTIEYGTVDQDGDASTVDQSVALNTAPCSGGSPTGCNLPGIANIGDMLSPTIITNGYLYVFGGCTNDTCSTTSSNVAYVAISSTGIMTKPATCPYGAYQGGTWCVDTVHTISGGIAAASPVVFNGHIYLVGGLNGTANKNTINRADLNSDGSISAWAATQSMTGLTMTNVSYTYAFARANPATASSVPGNLYVLGGCSASSAAGCTAYSTGVYKCNIQTAGTITGCTTTGQLQIGKVPGDTANTGGLGIMSGTVYANYIYLVGGVTPDQVDLKTIMYAKIDTNNNIVAVTSYPSGSLLTTAIGTGLPTGTGAGWVESAQQMAIGRRRSAAFGYNGYIYAVGGYEGVTGVLADIEFIKVNVSDGSLGSASDPWHTSAVQINQRWGLSVAVSNSYAYVIGGCTVGASPGSCTNRTDVIQTFQIYNNDSGSPSGYTTSATTYGASGTSTDPNRVGASSVVLNGYIYVAGGCTSTTDCTTAINKVSYAPIDAYGVIGTWSNTTAPLPAVRAWGRLETAGGSLYYIGGQSSTATDERGEVYYGTPSSGNIASWGTATNGLPGGNVRTKFGSTVWNNRIYVVGGLNGSAADTTTVYVSPQLNSGGDITSAWSTTSTPFNVARIGVAAVAYANNLYIFGGYDGANYLSDSQYSQISTTDGSVGAWAYSNSLPGPLTQADSFAANGYIYLIGGRSSNTTCDPVTLVAPVSANTTIASGNDPTGIGEWSETNQRYTGARYGATTSYYNGKAYVLGGGSCPLAAQKQTISAQGASTFVVPADVTSITVKVWSGGGGGAGGSSVAAGGAGGGSGYVNATIPVTPGETLTTYVGGGGSGGTAGSATTSGGGGGAGGYSSIYRGATPLVVIGGGGGGGGGRITTANNTGGGGGAGGGAVGVAGTAAGGSGTANTGGNAGTASAGGTVGTGGTNIGTAGSSLAGGGGGDGRNAAGNDGSGAAGGLATGAGGGSVVTLAYAGGGGGGSGYFGGAGGNGSNTTRGGSGGGGGSSYTRPTDVNMLFNTAGALNVPANSADTDRGTAGNGGTAGALNTAGGAGTNGVVVISYSSGLTYSSPVTQQTSLLSQPQVAKYSIMIDTDSDVFPNQWLLNGIDNSVGASWQLKYRSMPDTTTSCVSPVMTTWGSETNFGNVQLGLPGVYTPTDSSGVTTNCARFYYFNVTIDSSQAYGYPDDVSRGPTITDLTLQFTADPSKRLMHGRTFTSGLQQPDDTPYYAH